MNSLRKKTTATLLIAIFMISMFAVAIPIASAVGPYYVDAVAGDDGTGDGSEVLPWATIQHAVTTAEADSTIYVAAGTYLGTVIVNKPLTLKGANTGVPGTGTRGAESIVDAEDTFKVTDDLYTTWVPGFYIWSSDVTIDGFKIVGADEAVHIRCVKYPYFESESGDRENVVIKNNIIDTSEGVLQENIAATGIIFYNNAYWASVWDPETTTYSVAGSIVQDNYVIQAHDKASIWFQDVTGAITIKGNKVEASVVETGSGIIIGATSDLGGYVDIGGTVIEGNEIVDMGIGIHLKRITGSVSITENAITGAGGIRLWAGDASTSIVAQYNNLGLSDYGVKIKSDWVTTVDATLNWWGTKVPSEIAAMVQGLIGYVDYDPWLDAAYPAGVPMTSGPTTISASVIYPTVSFTVTESVDFSTIIAGGAPKIEPITITNTGDLKQKFKVELLEDTDGFYASYMKVGANSYKYTGWSMTLDAGDPDPTETVDLTLDVPLATPPKTYTGTLVFWAEAVG